MERAYLQGAKVIDLYSGGAQEGAWWSLESNHPFWKDRVFSYKNKRFTKRDFPTKCLIPMCKNLPDEMPDIFSLFTIPVSSLTENDLKAMLGNTLTKNEIALWRKLTDSFNRKTSLIDLTNMIVDAQKKEERTPGIHGTGISSMYNMFSTFEKHKLFTSDKCPRALNLKGELKNKKVVTSLILKYFPEELWGFIINHIIYKTYELIIQGEIKHPVVIMIREAGDFLVSLGTSSPQEEAIRYNFSNILRKGRKHRLFFWIDNQTPLNIDIIKTQFPIKICHFVDNTVELQQALGDLGAMLLTKDDYNKMRYFKPGRCYVLENRGLFNPQVFPALSRMSGDEGMNFVETWRKEKGNSRFVNLKVESQPIFEEYEEAKERWDEKLGKRKEKAKIAKEFKKMQKAKPPKVIVKEVVVPRKNAKMKEEDGLGLVENGTREEDDDTPDWFG